MRAFCRWMSYRRRLKGAARSAGFWEKELREVEQFVLVGRPLNWTYWKRDEAWLRLLPGLLKSSIRFWSGTVDFESVKCYNSLCSLRLLRNSIISDKTAIHKSPRSVSAFAMGKQNVALVAGATGIVGEPLLELLPKSETSGGPWKVYGLARRPRPEWVAPNINYIQCNLLNRDDVFSKLAPLSDVTHLFWVTWVARATEAENEADNEKAFRNALDALLSSPSNSLEHIALQTGAKNYLGSFEANMGENAKMPVNPFTEDLPRVPGRNFYYKLEDAMFETVEKSEGKITWSVHRPGDIYGVAEGNAMNFLGTVAVYGAICKHEGIPFRFPGTEVTWNSVREGSDADLIAEQEIWAATNPRGKNEAFNIANGDQFRWKKVWKSIAEKLGVEYVPFDGKFVPAKESMKDMGPVWDKIVEENGLRKKKVEEVGHWWFMDFSLQIPGDVLLSMNKSKELGFLGFRNTERTMLASIDKMRERKLIP